MIIHKKGFNNCLFLFLLSFHIVSGSDNDIPFPEALKRASIKVNSLNDILNGSLIVGNGDINALVYSNNNSVVMNLTKNDVWDARLETLNDPPIPTIDLIKQLGTSDTAFPLKNNNNSYVLPEGVTWQAKDSYHSAAYPCPRQCARIVISTNGNHSRLKGELDLQSAVAKIRESDSNSIEIRALADRNTFLVNTKKQILLEPIKSKDLPEATKGITNQVKWLKQIIPGDIDWQGMEFAVAIASDGNIKAIAIVTSIESIDVVEDAIRLAKETINSELRTLIQKHELEWEKFWSRSGIELGNHFLESTWYRSLYFLRCFSKPEVQSVGLFAGLINDVPSWHGDYHTNYNIQQTYWTAYSSNHPEIAEPYDRLMFEYLTRAKWLSKKVFSMEGAYYPHVMYAYELADPNLSKSRNGRQYIHHVWGMTLGVNGFSIQPLWWRYKYDPDPVRLKNIVYPVLNEVATFYAEFIEQCEGEKEILLGPSVSPEHWGWTKNLEKNFNGTFDIALIRFTLKAAIEASHILEKNHLSIKRFQMALQRLPNYPLFGEKQPIVVDIKGAPPIEYNIPVPATPVFPGEVVSWWSTEEEKQLFKRTIENLKCNGNNSTFIVAIARARLSMPGSQEWLETEIRSRTRPNATISLNTLIPQKKFNDYGHYTEQFGVGMAISELFLQSVDDIIRICPALSDGNHVSFRNLRTQGGFLVSADGTVEEVKTLEIKSLYGGELRLLSPWKNIESCKKNDPTYLPLEIDEIGVVTIQTNAGEIYLFRKFE